MARREHRPGSVLFPFVIGVFAGLALTTGWTHGPVPLAIGAIVGGAGLAVTDAVARARQQPNEIPALWSRIVMSAALAAVFGWLLGLTGAGPVIVGLIFGLIAGVLGVRPQKV